MTQLPITLAVNDYDHVRDLTQGLVDVQGVDLTTFNFPVEEIFYRFLHHREFDVSEFSFGKYVSMRSQGDDSVTAIPVFPSRMFRHSSIYVRSDSPLTDPRELSGLRLGLPEWAQTASIYSRGALMHEYGIALQDVEWIQAGVNQPGRQEKVDLRLPDGVSYTSMPDRSLSEMLEAGELDAILTAHPPAEFEDGGPGVRRLLSDAPSVERRYYEKTRIYPIMHVIAMRTELVHQHPWLPMELFKGFAEAKRRSVERALDFTAPRFPVPWIADHAATARTVFGSDFWPYGLEANRTTLEAFLHFASEQGVMHRPLGPEDLFVENTLDTYRI